MYQFRQGDVLVIRDDEIAKGDEVQAEQGRVILAHGEATGHAHALVAPPKQTTRPRLYLVPNSDDRALVVKRTTSLAHEEHSHIELSPGAYRVRRQKEYSAREIRNVAD